MIAKRCLVFFLASVVALVVSAGDDALVRITRQSDEDRNRLLNAGVPLVAELNDAFLALGDQATLKPATERLGFTFEILDLPDGQEHYAIAGIMLSTAEADMEACGEVVGHGEQWRLLKATSFDSPGCTQARSFALRVLPMRVLHPTNPPPERYEALQTGQRDVIAFEPLIQSMVNGLTDDVAMSHWQAIIDSALTRYSYADGCNDAAQDVYDLFDGLGLTPQFHDYNASFPPNVIGTLPGLVRPDEVVIVIGHLDSTSNNNPSTFAPGADDNASGAAMVTAVAEAMSCYEFEETVKFIAVTGEEQGLYGSSGYAYDANQANEDIQAVLNGDMIGFEGDSIPAAGEDLDVNTNSASVWLGNLMTQVATDYSTGIEVNAFSCPSMTYSDHAPFWDYQWSAICGITDNLGFCGEGGNYPYYHTDNDTIANCGPGAKAFEGGAIRVYLATAAELAVPIAAKTSTPTGLTAQADGDHRIALAWATSGSGYLHEVYRAPGGCSDPGPPVLLGTVATTNFTDTSASGQTTYGYWLDSVSGHCTSIPTACVEAATTGSCTEPPVFSGLEIVTNQASTNCGLELSWSTTPTLYCGSTASFTVYRSIDPAFEPNPANRIAENLSSAVFLDTESLISGQKYYYIVRAVDTSNGVEDTNLVRVYGTPTGPFTLGTWTDNAGDSGDAQLASQPPWAIRTDRTHSAPNAYGTGNYGNNTCAALTTPVLHLHPGAQLGFWSTYQIEADYDKGVVQISTDNGGTWEKVPVNYPDNAIYSSDQCGLPSGLYFSNDQLIDWAHYSASLATWADQDVLIRWRISSDGGVTEAGWWIDDIEITNVGVPGDCTTAGAADIFNDGFESGDAGVWSYSQP